MRTILSLLLVVSAVCVKAQNISKYHGFKALLNGKIAVEVAFETAENNGEWLTAGYIYYPKAKNPAPILIVNDWGDEKPVSSQDKNTIISRMVEFQPDGEITGLLYLTYVDIKDGFRMQKGSWKNPNTGRVLQLSRFEEMHEKPTWWPGSPAVLTAPKRDAWELECFVFNTDDDNPGWFNTIRVNFRVNDRYHALSFIEDLTSAVTLEMRNELQWMSEDDINFDGIPDLKVYMGVTQNGSSTYKCFVWNPVTRIFYPVPEFEEILEPDFDSKSKTITSIARSYTTTYIDVYKWKNCRLRKVSSKSIP